MLPPMGLLLDSFWRAVAYCLHPRVIALSLLPLALMLVAGFALGYFFWDSALVWMGALLDSWTWLSGLWGWLERFGAVGVRDMLAPFLLVVAATPLVVLVVLLMVAGFMTPALAALVATRRFPQLERKRGGSFIAGFLRSLGATLLALVALIVSMPLWLVPPLILVLPPLIWGWLTYRVMSFDALAEHASADERRELLRRHRSWLLGIGVMTGYLGAAPSLVWASGVLFAAAFFVLIPVAIWIYTLVFAFSSLWFSHYCLEALQRLRDETAATVFSSTVIPPLDDASPVSLPSLPDDHRPPPILPPPRA